MKKNILQYLKHLGLTLLIFIPALILFGLSQGASLNYGDQDNASNWNNDGPYVFYENDSTFTVEYVQGNRDDGFSIQQQSGATGTMIPCYYPYDSSSFEIELQTNFSSPPATYNDGEPIFAISDIEGNYRAFRDFLIVHGVVDQDLNWTFGKGHLVLVGDFVDRGAYVTQLLWLIYRLDAQSMQSGGHLHFIIGNHELKNLHGDFGSAAHKYFRVASFLDRQQYELLGPDALLGRWMQSKNAIEVINGHLFVHGGISPDLTDTNLDLETMNAVLRDNYRRAYFPKAGEEDHRALLSGRWGPCWYRGYFKEDLSDEEVARGLSKFGANDVIVGHTLQSKVRTYFNDKVIAIDVKHPSDHEKKWPMGRSEGLLVEGNQFYRIFDDGRRKLLK